MIKDSRKVPRFDKAPVGAFSPEGIYILPVFSRLLNLMFVIALEVVAALLNPDPCLRPRIEDIYAYKWIQDARRRAYRRELNID